MKLKEWIMLLIALAAYCLLVDEGAAREGLPDPDTVRQVWE